MGEGWKVILARFAIGSAVELKVTFSEVAYQRRMQ